jgi:uncharacterized protein YndB with AHSA1/START domain
VEQTAESTSVLRELEIDASPETVWEFLVDPDKATRWMGQTAELEPRAGGLYRVEVIPGNVARGEFVEVDAPRRLVFTWGWEQGEHTMSSVAPGTSTIEIELVPTGDGTTLRFSHTGLPSEEAAQSHAHGWDHYLSRLVTVTAGGDAGIDPWTTGEMS